jgi:hypothetical protein
MYICELFSKFVYVSLGIIKVVSTAFVHLIFFDTSSRFNILDWLVSVFSGIFVLASFENCEVVYIWFSSELFVSSKLSFAVWLFSKSVKLFLSLSICSEDPDTFLVDPFCDCVVSLVSVPRTISSSSSGSLALIRSVINFLSFYALVIEYFPGI